MDWTVDFVSTPDSDYDFVDIFFKEKEIATIKKNSERQIIISWRKSENDYDIPLDWFLGLLKEAQKRLQK